MSQPSAAATKRRVLYLDAYTVAIGKRPGRGSPPSSDAIGYAITSSTAIRTGLTALGWDVLQPQIDLPDEEDGHVRRLRWLLRSYERALELLGSSPPDVIFIFHAFSVFPTEIRRMILDLRLKVPLVGYTHGSHWDPTDTFRFEVYPGMEVADLANLCVLDRVLLVSHQMHETLRTAIGEFNPSVAKMLESKYEVVGLPLDVQMIEASRTGTRDPRPLIVFNHAPVASKDPEMFVRVMRRILPRYDVRVLFTRKFLPEHAGGKAVAALADDFGDRVVLGNNLALPDYYSALWRAELQVSTATHESLGVSTLEAMYAGCCCVLPRVGSYPEIVGDQPDVLYDRGDDQLEERLRYFLDHPERRRALAGELQQAADRYRPEVVVRRISEVLDSVCSSN
ncbi:MAG: glycosyltransferase-like protein 1 [Propionibacteriaceae bacterium]|nr:glycosyltransferase-like protein 1 [Propionibacteriaceae bacterium]